MDRVPRAERRAAVGDVELRRAGEERGHVAVRAEAEEEQVELDACERIVELGRRFGRLGFSPRMRWTAPGGVRSLSSNVARARW